MVLSRHIDRGRALTKKWGLPDTCTIYPKSGAVTVSPTGIASIAATAARTYNGSSNIPCRLDTFRSAHWEKLKAQTVVADDYYLVIPHDMTVEPDDIIVVNGRNYKIRKFVNQSEFDWVQEIIIAEVR